MVKEFVSQKGTTGIVIAALFIPYFVVSYLVQSVGFMVSWKRYNWGALVWCLLMAAYFVFVSGVGGSARFKIPSMPFYMVFTGIGITYLREKMRKRRIPEREIK